MLNFNLLNIFKNYYVETTFVKAAIGNIQKKFGLKRIITERGMALGNVHSHKLSC